MLVSKKSKIFPPPSDRVLGSAQIIINRLVCSRENNSEPIATSGFINIGPQIMEGSSPPNPDSILERMAY
jgi:hypothetical protein